MIVGTPTRLNLIPSGVMPVIYLNQTDAGYDKQFLIYSGDQPYNAPEGISVTIRGKKGDLNGITENVTHTVGSNLMTVRITEQMTAVAGDSNVFELVIVDTAGLRVGTINMIFAVEPDALGDAVISDSDIAYAEHVMTTLQSMEAVNNQVQQNKANITDEIQNRTAAVNAEALARQAADQTLQNNINAEATARQAADATLQGNINLEVTSRQSSDATLQAQINQYVKPSTEQPTEVVNARVGADGVTYPTLGQAIRTQFSDVIAAFGFVRTLSASDNLNSLNNGVYRIVLGDIPTNCPITSSGILMQFGSKNGIASAQEVINVNGDIFARYKALDGWLDWSTLTLGELKASWGYNRLLSSSDDLNALDNGVYRISSDSIPSNCPISASAILMQFGPVNKVASAQEIINTNGDIFTRYKGTTGWRDWARHLIKEDFEERKEAAQVTAMSGGELYRIPTTGNVPFMRYMDHDGAIEAVNAGEYGTDYIPAPEYLAISFSDTNKATRVIVYFFDRVGGQYVPRWDLLDFTTSDGIKNYLHIANAQNRVIHIPSGVYMKVCTAVSGYINLYGWTGRHFGCDLASTVYAPSSSAPYDEVHINERRTGLTIPGEAKAIFLKEGGMSLLIGVKEDGTKEAIFTGAYYQCYDLPDGYSYFRARIGEDYEPDYNVPHGAYIDKVCGEDKNDSWACLMPFSFQSAQGKALKTINRFRDAIRVPWVCRRYNISINGRSEKYDYNTVYTGIPYASDWKRACFYGWHISKHTFINAANDARSVFYFERGRNGGPGYGSVCSALATFCAGFPYPIVTRNLLRDPTCVHSLITQPAIGSIMYDGNGHCIIIGGLGEGHVTKEWKIYEEVEPFSLCRVAYDTVSMAGITRKYEYLDDYAYEIHSLNEGLETHGYDVANGYLVNGSARPYKGDRGVFTSDEDVQINIKSSNATKCIYQSCEYDENTDSFTLTGEPQSIDISGTAPYEIMLDRSTLEDDTIYAVWTDDDDTKEHFEYHVAPTASYRMTANNFEFNITSEDFWYASWWQDDTPSGITETVPYLPNGDYSKYRQVYNPGSADGYMFFKGRLGAYVVKMKHEA